MLEMFQSSRDVFVIKDIEKMAVKRGIIAQAVKDVLQVRMGWVGRGARGCAPGHAGAAAGRPGHAGAAAGGPGHAGAMLAMAHVANVSCMHAAGPLRALQP